jgi:hypothetical protein
MTAEPNGLRKIRQAPANGGVRLSPQEAEEVLEYLKALQRPAETKHINLAAFTKRRFAPPAQKAATK